MCGCGTEFSGEHGARLRVGFDGLKGLFWPEQFSDFINTAPHPTLPSPTLQDLSQPKGWQHAHPLSCAQAPRALPQMRRPQKQLPRELILIPGGCIQGADPDPREAWERGWGHSQGLAPSVTISIRRELRLTSLWSRWAIMAQCKSRHFTKATFAATNAKTTLQDKSQLSRSYFHMDTQPETPT